MVSVVRRQLLAAAASAGGLRIVRAAPPPVRIGITAVFLDDEVGFLRTWRDWLAQRLLRPVEFVTRANYREVIELIRTRGLDFAWVCGYPYVRHRADLRLVAVPLWQGKPLYRSYIIVGARDENSRSLFDLAGRVFAFSDPDSNSGHLYPRVALIRAGHDPDAFFGRAFFTWAHRLVVRAVAEGVAHAGAVDGYVYDVVAALQPQLTARTRVIERSSEFGYPPIVARRDIGAEQERAFFDALSAMTMDPDGRALLRRMHLDGFVRGSAALFDSIADMMRADTRFREAKTAKS